MFEREQALAALTACAGTFLVGQFLNVLRLISGSIQLKGALQT